ncbi:MAG TPA: DUF4175 family protein [Candidatus Limnocylindrales bacterium]|nr:DUF4175 family protein [Candidatus Limnocylindrales bacterium]
MKLINAALTKARDHIKTHLFLKGLLQLIILALAVLLMGILIYVSIPPSFYLNLIFDILVVLAFLYVSLKSLILPILRKLPDDSVALTIEEKFPDLQDNLINSVQLSRELKKGPQGISLDLIRKLIASTEEQVRKLDIQNIVDRTDLRKYARYSGIGVVVLLALILWRPGILKDTLKNFLHPAEGALLAQKLNLEIEPKNTTILRNKPLKIVARSASDVWKEVQLNYKFEKEPWKQIQMSNLEAKKVFQHEMKSVQYPFQYYVSAGNFTSETYQVQIADPPEIGDITLIYQYPQYTRIEPKTITNSDGNIEGIKGTQVHIILKANKKIIKAQIVTDDGTQIPLQITDDVKLEGDLIITKTQTYHIEVVDSEEFQNQDPIEYQITAHPDEYPTVEVLKPGQNLTVGSRDDIELAFSAKDDFGLTAVYLVFQGQAEETRVLIKKFSPGGTDASSGRTYLDKFTWRLSNYTFQPGQIVNYHLEVEDNDTISGPKKGSSATYSLEIYSEEKRHQDLVKAQEEVHQKLLELLADQVEAQALTEEMRSAFQENPGNPRISPQDLQKAHQAQQAISEKSQDLTKNLKDILNQMAKDPLSNLGSYMELNQIGKNLEDLHDSKMVEAQESLKTARESPVRSEKSDALDQAAQKQEEIASELEKLAAFSDNLLKKERMQDVVKTSEKLTRTQDQFLKDLEKLAQNPQDQQLLDQLMKELENLSQALNALMNQLSQLANQLPDEFLNNPNVKNLELGNMSEALEKIKEALQKGDLQKALEEARKLMSMLSQMNMIFQNAANQSMANMMQGAQSKAMEMANKLGELVENQKRVIEGTEKVDKALKEASQQEVNKLLKDALERMKRIASKIPGQMSRAEGEMQTVPDMYYSTYNQFQDMQEQLNKILNGLNQPRLGEVKEAVEESLRDVEAAEVLAKPFTRGVPQLQKKLDELKNLESLYQALNEELDRLGGVEGQAMSPSQESQMKGLASKQGQLQQDTGELKEKLANLSKLTPFLSPDIADNLGEAQDQMGSAKEKLGNKEAGKALLPEREALYRLEQAQQGLQQGMQQMATMQQMGGMAMPQFAMRPGMQPGNFPNFQFPNPNTAPNSGGIMGSSTEDIEIPSGADFQVPKEFREELLKAMKEGIPQPYEDLVKDYYKQLSQ